MRTIRNASFTLSAGQSNVVSEQKTIGQRVALEINNLNAAGGNDIFIAVDGEAAANKGRRIQPGQTIIWSKDSGYTPPQTRVTAYSVGADTISIYEEIES